MKRTLMGMFASVLMAASGFAQTTQPQQGGPQGPRVPVRVPDGFVLEANIQYDQYADTVLDVMYPKEPSATKRPGVVVFHGGGWVHSDKESAMNALCLPYLKQGFVVCNIEYRQGNNWGRSPQPAPAAVTDSLNAVKWFVDHADKYNWDPNRLVSTGASAGGHLALMMGMVTPEAKLGPVVKVAAIVNCYGPTDVADLIKRKTSFAVQWVPEQPGREELAKRLSPMTYVRKDMPPVFTVQGAEDHTVPVDQNQRLDAALKAVGAESHLTLIPGAGHGFTKEWPDIQKQIFEFLKDHKVIQ